ncbi:MAG TPA: helix-turn-helix transcriptional regulator [Planctomycetota bacterium]|nr:helix-turn-helix transcriptional regulator [Planctomycetota bacterium]
MAKTGKFGAFFKECRIALGITLREFCEKHGLDPGNLSKLERGLLPPPQSREKLEEYAAALQLKKGSTQWRDFFDFAFVEQGRIPDHVMAKEELVKRLPVLFRTMAGKRATPKQLDKLVKMLQDP